MKNLPQKYRIIFHEERENVDNTFYFTVSYLCLQCSACFGFRSYEHDDCKYNSFFCIERCYSLHTWKYITIVATGTFEIRFIGSLNL